MLKQRWNNYWFRSAPLLDLAVCRIIAVGYQLYYIGTGYTHYIGAAALPEFLFDPLLALEIYTWPLGGAYRPGAELLVATYWVTLGTGLAALVGWATRWSLGVFALGNVFLHAQVYSYGEIHHPEALMAIALVLLALSPAGAVLSVDDLRRSPRMKTGGFLDYLSSAGKRKSTYARWPLVLIQVLFALIYLDAGLSKLLESGLEWANGYTLQYYLAQDAMRWGSSLGLWLSQQHMLVQAMSCLSLFFELTFFLAVLFPPLALFYIPVGIGFHTGIYLTMKAPFFTFIALYSVFVPWSVLWEKGRRRLNAVGAAKTKEHAVLKPASS